MGPRLRILLTDIAIGVGWAALIAAVALFSAGASEFIYIDF